MIPVPHTEKRGLSSLPWFALALLLGYLLVHLVVQQGEQERQRELASWYQQSGLFSLEWENYISWLRISGQIPKAERLEAVRERGDPLALFQAMAFDPAFERENIVRGTQYWSEQEFNRWRQGREQFKQQAAALPSVRWGLNPVAPRPATYVSWHFLNNSLWPLLLTALAMLPLAWAVEGTLGSLRTLGATLLGGILVGLTYVALFRHSYVPVTGSTPIAALWAGLMLGLFRLRSVPCRYWHPTRKAWQETPLPAWLFTLPVLALLTYDLTGASQVPWALTLTLAALPIGLTLALLIEPKALSHDPERDDSTEGSASQDTDGRAYRQALTQAWAAMGTLAFREAAQDFRKAQALAPQQLNPVSGLFHLAKIHVDTPDFADACEKLWQVEPTDAGEVKQWIQLLREQARLTQDNPLPLSDTLRARLVATLARHGEALEADRYAQPLVDPGPLSDEARDALEQLAARHQQAGNSARANHWRQQLSGHG